MRRRLKAEAISEAVTRKTMRFVPIKSAEQQAAAMVLKTRGLLSASKHRQSMLFVRICRNWDRRVLGDYRPAMRGAIIRRRNGLLHFWRDGR